MLDTSVLIQAQRGRLHLADLLSSWKLLVPAVAMAEFLVGFYRLKDDPDDPRRAEIERFRAGFLDHVPVVDFDASAAERFGQMVGPLVPAGVTLDPCDALIAATALAYGSAVATTNERHFRMIPGLTVVSPQKRQTPDPSPDPGRGEG